MRPFVPAGKCKFLCLQYRLLCGFLSDVTHQRVGVIAMNGCENNGIFLVQKRSWMPYQYEFLCVCTRGRRGVRKDARADLHIYLHGRTHAHTHRHVHTNSHTHYVSCPDDRHVESHILELQTICV